MMTPEKEATASAASGGKAARRKRGPSVSPRPKKAGSNKRRHAGKDLHNKTAIIKTPAGKKSGRALAGYGGLMIGIAELFDAAKRAAARSVNALMTAAYWEIGRRIVEHEQEGQRRASYGDEILQQLADDLTMRLGRGFSRQNLHKMRQFYMAVPPERIRQTVSGELAELRIRQTVSGESADAEICSAVSSKSRAKTRKPRNTLPVAPPIALADLAKIFPLPWSQYSLLITRSRSPEAFAFYHAEALRGGWSVRQLQRQIDSQFYERTALSRDKAKMLGKGAAAAPEDAVSADEEIRHPLVLEFLGLRDEYSETDLEGALVLDLENFLLELGNDFTFVGRQRRLRIDDEWYRVDLLFFHRRLRCLVIFDLKLGRFSHADAGQMQVYLNFAREHWTQPGENPPIGVILCSGKSEALVRYATGSLPNKMLVREYLTALPDERVLAAELERSRKHLEKRK
jgi:predicted nuclease of restriction endonuclease-like (RecB) superfamily